MRLRSACVLIAGFAATGCATTSERMAPVRAAWDRGDLAAAAASIETLDRETPADDLLLDLARVSVRQASGAFVPSVQVAEKAMARMRENEGVGVVEGFQAAIRDDTALAYAGDDHEKVLVRAMAALSLLAAGQRDEARALALQMNREQERLRGRPVLREDDKLGRDGYRDFAFAEVLRALIDEDKGDFDEAAIGWQRALDLGYAPAASDLARVKESRVAEPGRGAVVVIALAGPGPIKVERTEPVTSVVLMVASSILNARKGAGFPSQAPVVVPVPQGRPSRLESVAAGPPGARRATAATALDVVAVSRRQAEDALPATLLRAVVRRAVKEVAKEQVKRVVTGRDGVGALLADIGGWIWTGSERADTRGWELLPGRFAVARLHLPPGDQVLDLAGVDRAGNEVTPTVRATVRVREGRTAFVLVVAPSEGTAPFAYVDGLSRVP